MPSIGIGRQECVSLRYKQKRRGDTNQAAMPVFFLLKNKVRLLVITYE